MKILVALMAIATSAPAYGSVCPAVESGSALTDDFRNIFHASMADGTDYSGHYNDDCVCFLHYRHEEILVSNVDNPAEVERKLAASETIWANCRELDDAEKDALADFEQCQAIDENRRCGTPAFFSMGRH